MKNNTFGAREQGASLVEYSLLLVLVALVSLAAVAALGQDTAREFDTVAAELAGPAGGDAGVPGEEADPGRGDEATDPGDGSEDESTDPGDGSEDESTDPGDGSEHESTDPGDGSEDESTDPGDGSEDESTDPGSGTGTDGGDAPVEVPAEPGSEVEAQAGDSDWYWWDDRTDKGAWMGTVAFENEYERHQYLTIEVTKTTANGKTIKETIRDFYVPANGSSNLQIWDNEFSSNKHGTAQGNSVISIELTVTKIKTSDENWETKTFSTSGPTVGVEFPSVP